MLCGTSVSAWLWLMALNGKNIDVVIVVHALLQYRASVFGNMVMSRQQTKRVSR